MQINRQSYLPAPCPSAITFYNIQNELYTAKQYNSKLLSVSLIKVLKNKKTSIKMYITLLRKNQSMQIKYKIKSKKGKMLVYEETRQKQKKKQTFVL